MTSLFQAHGKRWRHGCCRQQHCHQSPNWRSDEDLTQDEWRKFDFCQFSDIHTVLGFRRAYYWTFFRSLVCQLPILATANYLQNYWQFVSLVTLLNLAWKNSEMIMRSSAKSGPGTAYYFHANVRATSQHTFERSYGHSKLCCVLAQTFAWV